MRVATLLLLFLAVPALAETIDGIAATVDDTVVTISDLDRLAALRIVPRHDEESDDAYRSRMLQHLIARHLQRRDIRRFAEIEVDPRIVDREFQSLVARHGSRDAFDGALRAVGMKEDDVRDLLAMEIEVRTYIDERFAPLVFVPLEDIESYYHSTWSQYQREQGLGIPPLSEVRERLRDLLRAEQLSGEVDRWTRQLRSRANVDVFVYR